MAKFLSQVYTCIRGSVGGITYTANKYASLLARARVSPTQPGSTYQNQFRSAFASAETHWKALTDQQRIDWDTYAASCSYSGPMGNYVVDGRQMMLGITALAIYANYRFSEPAALGYLAPTDLGWLSISFVDVTAPSSGNTGFKITMVNDNSVAVFLHSVMSRPQNASRLTWHGPYLTAGMLSWNLNASQGLAMEFSGLTAGKAYFVRFRSITQVAPFRISQEVIVRAIAVTTP